MLSICCCKFSVPYLINSSNQNPKFPNHSYTNYLINHLGFSHQEAQSIYTKLPHKYHARFSKFSGNADSVIDFLKQSGFDDSLIKKAVSSYPQILSVNVEQTLKPKFKVFQDHGFSESDLVSVISSSPSIVAAHVDPIIGGLREILGSNDIIIKFLRKHHLKVGPSTLRDLNSNVALLNKEYGVDINVIRKAILQIPGSYLRNSKFFQNTLVSVEKELGIPRNSGMFIYGIHLLCNSSKKTIESKCEVLKSFGWTEYDVFELMRKNPSTFLMSEENIRKKLGFLMAELGYKPDFITKHYILLFLSLEKRLGPRHRVLLVLKEKGLLDYNFHSAAKLTEKQFLMIIIKPFIERAPDILDLYLTCYEASAIK